MNNMIELAKQQVKETVMNALGRLGCRGQDRGSTPAGFQC